MEIRREKRREEEMKGREEKEQSIIFYNFQSTTAPQNSNATWGKQVFKT